MRQLSVAEFIFILNTYKGLNIWDFTTYVVEWYKRDKINELWQIYVAKCVSAGIDKNILPEYSVLLKQIKGESVSEKSSKKGLERLIDKVNKANGGDN